MSALRAIQLAIDMAERQRDQVARELAAALQNQLAASGQKDMLEAYARETESKWIARAQAATSPELMRHHYQFLAKLDQAIVFQQGVIRNHVDRVAQVRHDLMEAEQKLARFKHIFTARQAEAIKLQNRREQKQADEWASRMRGPQKRHLDAEEVLWVSN